MPSLRCGALKKESKTHVGRVANLSICQNQPDPTRSTELGWFLRLVGWVGLPKYFLRWVKLGVG